MCLPPRHAIACSVTLTAACHWIEWMNEWYMHPIERTPTPRATRSPTSCARGDTICLSPVQVDNIFVSIRQVAPVPTCCLFKTSATSSPLTFWPWKWCPSHVWRRLPLCQFLVFLDLSVLELGPMYATDRQTSGVRQKHRLNPPPYGGGGIIITVIW